jgi:hypothetical protein
MTQELQASSQHHEITVASDWITTVGMIVLLVFCVWLLVRDIEKFFWGHLAGPAHIQRSFWSIWNKVFETIAAIYFFLFAFGFTQRAAKIACVLMGTWMAAFVLLSFFNLSLSVRHVVAVTGSIIHQIALAIFCVAIIQWLKRVVRWSSPPEPQGGDR